MEGAGVRSHKSVGVDVGIFARKCNQFGKCWDVADFTTEKVPPEVRNFMSQNLVKKLTHFPQIHHCQLLILPSFSSFES